MASGEWRVASGEWRVASGELGGLPRVAGRPAARWAERAERSWAAGTMRLSARVRRRSLALAGARRRSPALHGATCGRRFDLSGRRFGFSVQSSYLGEILVEILLGSHPETASAPRSGKRTENESVGRGFGALEPEWRGASGTGSPITCFFPSSPLLRASVEHQRPSCAERVTDLHMESTDLREAEVVHRFPLFNDGQLKRPGI